MSLERFKPYPVYKDSGVEWLGEIPTHWEVKRLKHLAHVASGFAPPQTYDRSIGEHPVYGSNGLIGYCDEYLVTEEILAIGRVGASGSVNIVPPRSWVSDNALLLRDLLPSARLAWLRYVLETMNLGTLAAKNAQPIITGTFLGNQTLAAPGELEQRAIAAFLDRETARIDALVAKKERLIALLQEQRTALITRAVTKGLDPTVPMKDSGVEWLGEIPAHWEVKKWRYCCHVTEGQVAPVDDRFRDRFLIAPNHIESGTGRILYTETADEQGAISGKYLVSPGDIIYSKIRPALNKVCIAGGHWLCSADMYPVTITEKRLEARFLLYFMLSEPFVRLMVDESMRVAMPKVNREKLAACPLVIPDTDEQRAIAAFLDRETARIDTLVAKVRDAIERLKELRTALISAAVTGKIDVREGAAV